MSIAADWSHCRLLQQSAVRPDRCGLVTLSAFTAVGSVTRSLRTGHNVGFYSSRQCDQIAADWSHCRLLQQSAVRPDRCGLVTLSAFTAVGSVTRSLRTGHTVGFYSSRQCDQIAADWSHCRLLQHSAV